jgi:hypothetical protein
LSVHPLPEIPAQLRPGAGGHPGARHHHPEEKREEGVDLMNVHFGQIFIRGNKEKMQPKTVDK